jgi:hypothetical protein
MIIPDPKTATKSEGWKKISCHTFSRSYKFHKIENYFIFKILKKKIWANFQRIIELFTQKIVTKLSKIWVWDPEKTYSGSQIQGSKRHRISDTDPQHWIHQEPGSRWTLSCLEIIWFVVFFLFLVELHDGGENGAPVLGGELAALGGLARLLQVNLTLHHPDTLTHTIWVFIWQTYFERFYLAIKSHLSSQCCGSGFIEFESGYGTGSGSKVSMTGKNWRKRDR